VILILKPPERDATERGDHFKMQAAAIASAIFDSVDPDEMERRREGLRLAFESFAGGTEMCEHVYATSRTASCLSVWAYEVNSRTQLTPGQYIRLFDTNITGSNPSEKSLVVGYVCITPRQLEKSASRPLLNPKPCQGREGFRETLQRHGSSIPQELDDNGH